MLLLCTVFLFRYFESFPFYYVYFCCVCMRARVYKYTYSCPLIILKVNKRIQNLLLYISLLKCFHSIKKKYTSRNYTFLIIYIQEEMFITCWWCKVTRNLYIYFINEHLYTLLLIKSSLNIPNKYIYIDYLMFVFFIVHLLMKINIFILLLNTSLNSVLCNGLHENSRDHKMARVFISCIL